jgi:hypothetical protein
MNVSVIMNPFLLHRLVVTPAQSKGPVPMLMMFGGLGGDGMPRPAGSPTPTNRFSEFGGPFKDPPSTVQLLAAGRGYATINPGSIQADTGAIASTPDE